MKLINPKFRQVIEVPIGFSIKALLFGPFLLLFERQFLAAFLHLCLSFGTFGLFWILYARKYNRAKILSLLSKGYRPKDQEDKDLIEKEKLFPSKENKHIFFSRLGSADHLFPTGRRDPD